MAVPLLMSSPGAERLPARNQHSSCRNINLSESAIRLETLKGKAHERSYKQRKMYGAA